MDSPHKRRISELRKELSELEALEKDFSDSSLNPPGQLSTSETAFNDVFQAWRRKLCFSSVGAVQPPSAGAFELRIYTLPLKRRESIVPLEDRANFTFNLPLTSKEEDVDQLWTWRNLVKTRDAPRLVWCCAKFYSDCMEILLPPEGGELLTIFGLVYLIFPCSGRSKLVFKERDFANRPKFKISDPLNAVTKFDRVLTDSRKYDLTSTKVVQEVYRSILDQEKNFYDDGLEILERELQRIEARIAECNEKSDYMKKKVFPYTTLLPPVLKEPGRSVQVERMRMKVTWQNFNRRWHNPEVINLGPGRCNFLELFRALTENNDIDVMRVSLIIDGHKYKYRDLSGDNISVMAIADKGVMTALLRGLKLAEFEILVTYFPPKS
jgi:hypothetical protein